MKLKPYKGAGVALFKKMLNKIKKYIFYALFYKGGGVALFKKLPNGGYAILLGKRVYNPGAKKWSIPGGGWNPKEDKTLADTAKREFYEEILKKNNKQFETFIIEYNAKLLGEWKLFNRWTTLIYEIDQSFEAPEVFSSEFSELKFIPLSKLGDYKLAFGVKREIKKFLKRSGERTVTPAWSL